LLQKAQSHRILAAIIMLKSLLIIQSGESENARGGIGLKVAKLLPGARHYGTVSVRKTSVFCTILKGYSSSG
jgi:hypothetical protein